MTFLNPAILWGLAAISIPIIIHIFNLKRTKKIEFSTLMFLKEIQQSKYKKIKLKQFLILLCRIAFIILLVLVFAHPFQKGYLGAGQKARSSVLLILDDSFSMQTKDAKGNDFENAKNKLTDVINVLDINDEVYFTPVSKIDRADRILYKDFNELKDTVNKTKISDITKSLPEVLYFANKILESASHEYKEVFFFTDGQKTFVENSVNLSSELKTDERTKLNIILSGSRNANNISVDTINVVTKIFQKNKNVKLKCTVNNHNNFNVLNKSIILNYEGLKPVRIEKVIDIPANSSVDAEFDFSPDKSGYGSGNIELLQTEISDDEISADNKRYFCFYIPSQINLLEASSSSSDLSFINTALSASEELMKDSTGVHTKFFDIKQVSENELSRQELKNYNCVLLCNKTSFTNDEAEKLTEYIENGGGLIIYPGANTSVQNYNDALLKKMNLPYINSSFGDNSQTFKFARIDYEHPVFEGIFKEIPTQNVLAKESPEIKSGLNLIADKNSIPLITLNNEKNFLTEYSFGKGRILFFAVSPDMKNSDYPSKNLFSPITVRSILYLSNTNSVKEAVTGKDYFLDLSSSKIQPGDSVYIFSSLFPNDKNNIGNSISNGASLINLKRYNNFTSVYSVASGNNLLYKFPSNFDKKESITEKSDVKTLEKILKESYKIDANIIEPKNTLTSSILKLRTGSEIWQYFLIFALLFLVIEFLLARSVMSGKTKNKLNL